MPPTAARELAAFVWAIAISDTGEIPSHLRSEYSTGKEPQTIIHAVQCRARRPVRVGSSGFRLRAWQTTSSIPIRLARANVLGDIANRDLGLTASENICRAL